MNRLAKRALDYNAFSRFPASSTSWNIRSDADQTPRIDFPGSICLPQAEQAVVTVNSALSRFNGNINRIPMGKLQRLFVAEMNGWQGLQQGIRCQQILDLIVDG
jgi:hypothetical protein